MIIGFTTDLLKGCFGEHATDSFDDYVMSGALHPTLALHPASVFSPKPILGQVHAAHRFTLTKCENINAFIAKQHDVKLTL